MEAFPDEKLNVAKMTISACDLVENIFWKRRNCWLLEFYRFPTMFPKVLRFRVVKNWGLRGKELTLSLTSPGFYMSALHVF